MIEWGNLICHNANYTITMKEKCLKCKKELPENGYDYLPKLQGNFCSSDCYNEFRDNLIREQGRAEIKQEVKDTRE